MCQFDAAVGSEEARGTTAWHTVNISFQNLPEPSPSESFPSARMRRRSSGAFGLAPLASIRASKILRGGTVDPSLAASLRTASHAASSEVPPDGCVGDSGEARGILFLPLVEVCSTRDRLDWGPRVDAMAETRAWLRSITRWKLPVVIMMMAAPTSSYCGVFAFVLV